MKRDAPAAHRNREPILAVLRDVLPPGGLVLELASGTGQHAVWFAEALPQLEWQPTDRDPAALASIAAWRAEGPPNVRPPLELDLLKPWPVRSADAVVAINVIHASPWPAAQALLAGAAAVLPPGGPVVLYGAWRDHGRTEPSNEAFDLELKSRDPSWGLKDLEDLRAEAERVGLAWDRVVAMPANNRTVVLRK